MTPAPLGQAVRHSKDLWRAGFRVQVTEDPGEGFYVWRA